MKLITVIAVVLFSAKTRSEAKVTASTTSNVDQDKVSIDAVEDNLASSNHMVVNSLRAHTKGVDIDWKTNLNTHLASGSPNNSNAGGQGEGADIRAFDIQNFVRSDEESIEKPEDVLHSGVCKAYIDNAYKEVAKIFDNTPEGTISNYLCSGISLTIAEDKAKEAKETVAMEPNPCAKALKQTWADAEESIHYFMGSSEACHAEIGREIADIKGGSPNSYVRVDEEEGALVTLSIACIMFCWSDKRLKKDINYVGRSPMGIPTYTFKYHEGAKDVIGNLDTESIYFGVMAQDLLELEPSAVVESTINGYYSVDYSKIDVNFHKLV